MDTVEPMDTVELGAAQTAAMDAANAAKTASNNAAAEVAGAAASQDADTSSYTLARIAAQDAMESYMAAKAASDAAAATEDTAVAQAQQAIAEARQADAEVALAEAMRLAGVVAMAQQALDDAETERMALDTARMDAETERMALDTARMEAMAAASAAKDAYEAAKMAVAAVEANQGSDQDSYDVAKAAEMAAHEAYMDAKSASDAAAMATSSADAEMYRNTAQEKQEDAETAQGNAMTHAGMVSTAHTEATDLVLAKMKADEAADAAEVAHKRARDAAAGVAMRRPGSTEASSAESAAVNAQIAAALARNASDRAQTAMVSGDAEAEQLRAEAFKTSAERYRETATTIETAVINGDDETVKLTMARGGANTAHVNASQHATDARQAADDVALLLGTTHASATAAGDEATKAEAARDEAMRLSDLADATDDPGMAEEYRVKAEMQEANAMAALGQVNHYLTLAKIGVGASETQQIASLARQAQRHANRAEDHYNNAKASAVDAQNEVDAANASVNKARAARTDVTNASKHLMAAMTARNAANTARDNAKTAWDAAVAAVESAKQSTSILDAEDHLDTASNGENTAEEESETAAERAGDAETAAMSAADSANRHVIGLLMMANAYHIGAPDSDVSEADSVTLAKNRADHVSAVNTRIVAAAASVGNGGGDATVSWPYENAGTDDVDGDGLLQISVMPTGAAGTAVALVRADADADPVVTANFVLGPGLGDFPHEKYITGREVGDKTATNTGTRVILFTDIEQASAPVEAMSVALTNEPVSNVGRIAPTAAPGAPGEAGAFDFAGTYDHDGDPDTAVLAGTFDCVNPATCRLTRTGTGDGGGHEAGTKVTSISGYTFTGAGTTAEVLTMEDLTYLVFGVWLTETDADPVNDYAFGAFADGVSTAAVAVDVTGEATYEGSAAGVRSTASKVDFFSADAELKAKFGTDIELGIITGKIHTIVAGGVDVPDAIYLDLSDQDVANNTDMNNIVGAGTFTGRTRMGMGTLGLDGEQDYPLNGMWSGQFYNGTDTAPDSVAGTFGVSRADDDMNESLSYVGAFGAHKTE